MEVFSFDSRDSWNRRHYMVFVIPSESVMVQVFEGDDLVSTKVFKVGDEVEYDSYNLSYTGRIVAIKPKTCIVQPPYADERVKRLKWYDFSWRNWNFDAAETRARNNEISRHL